MAQRISSSAATKARAFLDEALAAARSVGRAPLPTLREMAALAGVSYGTMASVVRRYRKAGTVRSAGRRGLFAAGTDDAPPDMARETTRWQRTERQLEADILDGVFGPGELLPTYKELHSRYGANYRTLKKALLSLTQQGLVGEEGRRFMVARPSRTPARSTVALVNAVGVSGRGRDFLPPRILAHYRSLEEECSIAGVGLDVVTSAEAVADPTAISRRLSSGTLGFLVWAAYMNREQVRATLTALPPGVPVALLDESGAFHGPDFVPLVRGPFRFYTLGTGTQDGTIVGRYLYRLGHRRMAWFSPLQGEQWSMGREAGLRRAMERSSEGAGAVQGFGFGLTAADQRDWYRGGMVRRALNSLETMFDHPRFRRDPMALRTLDFVRDLREGHVDTVGRRLDAEFARALSDASITAWVCVSDGVAIRALSWLQQQGVDVPGRVSVVGFDDSIEAFFEGLTSYNFNVPAVTRAMLNHVLSPARPVGLGQGRAVSARGYVNVRSSTGPAAAV